MAKENKRPDRPGLLLSPVETIFRHRELAGDNRLVQELGKSREQFQIQSEQLFNILDSMVDGVAIINRDFGMEYVNPSMRALYGDINGRKCYQYFRDRMSSCPWCDNDLVFSGQLRDECAVHKLGKLYEIASMPLNNVDGSVAKLTIYHDITARKKAEQTKDDFIGLVSHELRTPLTVVIGALNTARHRELSREQVDDLIADAAASSDTLAGIVENLLELSRFQADRLVLHKEPVIVAAIVRQVVKKLQPVSVVHHLVQDLPQKLPVVNADPVRVERILYNLVENAIKYSPGGGEVRISARPGEDSLVACVRDQGPGISPENQQKLFQSFEQLGIENRHAIQGVGLGLKVCRTLVEAHGGRTWVESEPGKGSSFFFTLPVKEAVAK